jgi:alkylation response protein AidB-like acyl-CoA dehydrogenase
MAAVSHPISGTVGLKYLTEDETLFRDSVRQFARETISPLVREMDEHQKMDASLIRQLFELGLMGIEIPEAYGGAGGTFFEAILAVEEISAVDPSIGVLVDVQNTLVINALLRWATDEQKQRYLPRMAKEWVGAYALSEAASGSDSFALQARA